MARNLTRFPPSYPRPDDEHRLIFRDRYLRYLLTQKLRLAGRAMGCGELALHCGSSLTPYAGAGEIGEVLRGMRDEGLSEEIETTETRHVRGRETMLVKALRWRLNP